MDYWTQADTSSADVVIKWTDILTAVGSAAAAIGTLAALIFFGLQLRTQSGALRNQRDASDRSLKALSEQIADQVKQTQYAGEQARLQTEQTAHVAEQTKLLAQQAELVARTNRAILYQNIEKEMLHLSRIFLDEPGLRQYFYDGAPPPDDPILQAKVEILSELFVDFIALTLNTDFLFDDEDRAAWHHYFEHIATMSPSMQKYWSRHYMWYQPLVREALDSIIKRVTTNADGPPY